MIKENNPGEDLLPCLSPLVSLHSLEVTVLKYFVSLRKYINFPYTMVAHYKCCSEHCFFSHLVLYPGGFFCISLYRVLPHSLTFLGYTIFH